MSISNRMRWRLLFLAALMAISVYAHEALSSDKELYVKNDKKNISKLITKYADYYKLDRTYLSCLFKIESEYRLSAISKTKDYGIGQINEKTALSSHYDLKKLTTDLDYSIQKSAFMLAYYQWLFKQDEGVTWVCRYNVGPGPLSKRGRYVACLDYLERFYGCTTSNLVGVL